MSQVVFPRVSQITERRDDLVALIKQQFPAPDDRGRTWFVSGGESTRSLAEVYQRLWQMPNPTLAPSPAVADEAHHHSVGRTPYVSESERLCEAMLEEPRTPRMLIYVGVEYRC